MPAMVVASMSEGEWRGSPSFRQASMTRSFACGRLKPTDKESDSGDQSRDSHIEPGEGPQACRKSDKSIGLLSTVFSGR